MSKTALISRFFEAPNQSFFLFGPRGTGKSVLMKERYGEAAVWIDLLEPDVLRQYAAHPEHLFALISGNPQTKTIVIDEVQRVPQLLSVVHKLIEEKKGFVFVLTGSSARKIKQTGADLLGGRALERSLYPFMAAELAEKFSLSKALEEGLLPLVFDSLSPKDTLQTYINLYLREEIQAEGLVRNLDDFARFLNAVTFSHASLLNVTNIARECGVKRKTVENYISILEDLLLAYQLPVFTRKAKRHLIAHPKLYLFDTGVFRALRPEGPMDKVREIEGAALEGLVAQHLVAWNGYQVEKHDLAFWRTRGGVEVDFVVYGPRGFWAIEVKNSLKVFKKDTAPLESFLQDYPMAKGILLYRGRERLRYGNVFCIPCEEFLSQLHPDGVVWSDES